VAFRADGGRLASCSYDGTVLVWDTGDPSRPAPLARLRHRRLVNGAAWNPADPALLATASADKTVAVWRIPERGAHTLVGVLARHTDDVNAVAWMPDGRRLACVSEDGRATLWDTRTGALIDEIGGHTAHCMMVAVSRDGLVATVGEDGRVAVGEPGRPASAEVLHYATSIEGCAWSHSGKVLAVARDDGVVNLLTPRLECLRTIAVSTSAARSVAWMGDDSSFVVGAYDGSLHHFDVTGEAIRRIRDPRVWPRSVAVSNGVVAAGSFWNGPHLLDAATGREIAGPTGPGHGPNALAVLGRELLIGCDSGTVVAVGVDETSGPRGGRPPVRGWDMSDSPVLSLAARNGTVYWGTYAGRVIRRSDGSSGASDSLGAPVSSLCLAGNALVAGTYNGDLVTLDPRTLAPLDRGVPHAGSVKSLSALGDEGRFLSASTDRRVAAGPLHDRATLWEHGNLVNAVTSLHGRVVASASRDHTVKVGLLEPPGPRDGGAPTAVRRMRTLIGADESVKCVGLLGTPAAPIVLAGSYDFGLYCWEVDWTDGSGALASGRLVTEFRQGVSCMTALDERRVAVAGWDGQVLVVGRGRDGAVRELLAWDIGDLVERSGRLSTGHTPAPGPQEVRT
jgi:WD40 repeat protein